MRGKSLISIALILAIATVAATSTRVRAQIDVVRVYVWNPATGDNVYPVLPSPQPTFVEVWIDSPLAWENTPNGIVAYTVSLRVDPTVVEVLTALQWPDTDFDGWSNGFLGQFLADHFHFGFNTAFLVGAIDPAAGTILEASESILGFATLGLGAGGGPEPLMRFVIRTRSGVDPATAYSPIDLFDVFYVTVDGVKHPVDIVEGGHYGPEPVPEFPLGLGLMIAVAPAIPIVYLWRNRKKGMKQ